MSMQGYLTSLILLAAANLVSLRMSAFAEQDESASRGKTIAAAVEIETVATGERPPLSLDEAVTSLKNAADSIHSGGANLATETQDGWIRRLDSVIAYIRRIDGANPKLPNYRWHFVDRGKAKDAVDDTDVFQLPRAIPGVSAIAFRVSHGDVRVQSVKVYGTTGLSFEFDLQKDIRADLPRREVCLMDTEVALSKIEITYRGLSRLEAKAPRISIEAGISSVPEYARQSVYELSLARRALADRDSGLAERHIRAAIKSLDSYRSARKL